MPSFATALSALAAHTTAIDVIGNNLANLNTPGFKASVVSFHDLVTQSLGAGLGETQVGFGVGVPVTLRQFSQGAIQSSGGPLDASIQGDGFFVIKGSANQTLYTRGGNFQVDTAGNLTMATGERLQGWSSVGAPLDVNLPIGDITVPVGSLKAPIATTNFSIDLNLDASATDGPPADAFSTSVEVFDSLGNSHIITTRFTKTANANEWDYALSFPDADLTAAGTPVTGTVQFDSSGQMISPAITDAPLVLAASGLKDGAADMSITWKLFAGTTPRITQFSQPSASSALAQDGAAAANLVRVGLGNGGKILAQYSNGQQVVVGQVAMATVRNPESLIASGNSTFQLSARTALPAVGLPDTGGRGSVLGGTVEASTVDIAREFTNLIVYQRGYQANARMITTVDDISQETINLKR
ncbi:MAG: flagellar hook protein FlgE [Bryobacteraceae bacterium]